MATREPSGSRAATTCWPHPESRLQRLWDMMESLPTPPGLSVVDQNYIVVKANAEHLKTWRQGIVGRVCYEIYNRFAEPCPWCPVAHSFQDRVAHVGTAVSPHDDGMLYSVIVAVPDEASAGRKATHVLEIVFDITSEWNQESEERQTRYVQLSQLAKVLEEEPEDYAGPLLLLGAVSPEGLRFDSAKLVVVKPDPRRRHVPRVDHVMTLTPFAGMPRLEGLAERKKEDILKDIGRVWEECQWPEGAPQDVLGCLQQMGAGARNMTQRWLRQPHPVRWRTDVAACGIAATPGILHSILVGQVDGKRRLVSDDMLADLRFFSSTASQAIERSGLRSTLHNLSRIYYSLKADQPAFIAGMMWLLMGLHEFLAQVRDMEAAGQHLQVRQEGIDEGIRDAIQGLVESATSIRVSAESLTNLAGLARPKLQREHFDALVEKATRDWKPRLRRKRIELRTDLKAHYSTVMADKRLVDVMLANLFRNAEAWLKDVQRPKIISISTANDGDDVVLRFEDNGLGIDPGFVDRIFEPFASGRGTDGLGLGLPIVQRVVVDIHKGAVSVDPGYGKGAKFLVRLPRHKER